MEKERAKIRLEHWLRHSKEHAEEYAGFARELIDGGFERAGNAILKLADLQRDSTSLIEEALNGLREEKDV